MNKRVSHAIIATIIVIGTVLYGVFLYYAVTYGIGFYRFFKYGINYDFVVTIEQGELADWKKVSQNKEQTWWFTSLNETTFNQLITYMKNNNVGIAAGEYEMGTAWSLKQIKEVLVFVDLEE